MNNTNTSIDQQVATENEIIHSIVNRAIEDGASTALWRLPNSNIKTVLVSGTPRISKEMEPLEELAQGFLFAPFDRSRNTYYLKADNLYSFQDGELMDEHSSKFDHQTLSNSNESDQKGRIINFYKTPAKHAKPCNHDTFTEIVKEGVKQIEAGVFEKVVPSRCKFIPLTDSFDPLRAFNQLCESYPNAMVSLVSIPEVGTWLGATPELLVQVEDQTTFKTIALAGTKSYHQGIDLKNVAWTQKEIEEQALVSRYIVGCFKKIRLREFDEHGPKTSVAGNIMHLKTEYTVDMKATNFPQLGSVMLNLLHPTSAVCGMPLEPALQFLHDHEKYDRDFYSGYLGPVNIYNNTNIFVNLRCMKLMDQTAVLFAGAGVTIDSEAQKEWDETETKMNTLLNVIL